MKKKTTYSLIFIAIISITLIIFASYQVIFSDIDLEYFTIDFNNKSHIISSYGTLIGALLTFLSIIFVFYGVLQQKWKIEDDKKFEESLRKNDLLELLKLTNNLIVDILGLIIENGVLMKKYAIHENSYPLKAKVMNFKSSRVYDRMLNMDTLNLFKAFQLYLPKDKFSKDFLNVYKNIDFYSDSYLEMKKKYEGFLDGKTHEIKRIASMTEMVISNSTAWMRNEMNTDKNGYKNNKW